MNRRANHPAVTAELREIASELDFVLRKSSPSRASTPLDHAARGAQNSRSKWKRACRCAESGYHDTRAIKDDHQGD